MPTSPRRDGRARTGLARREHIDVDSAPMIHQVCDMVDLVFILRDRNHIEDLHQHAVELDHIPARLDEPGVEEERCCAPEERDLTRVAELVPPVEERVIEKRVDSQFRQKLRYGVGGCRIDVAPDREMQLGAMAGAGHRYRGHSDGGEGRDIDLGGAAPGDDFDTIRPSVSFLIILINDGVIRLAEPLQVLAIDLSDKWRSSHIRDQGRQWRAASRDVARPKSPRTIHFHIYVAGTHRQRYESVNDVALCRRPLMPAHVPQCGLQ
jgi:hypothetical protein